MALDSFYTLKLQLRDLLVRASSLLHRKAYRQIDTCARLLNRDYKHEEELVQCKHLPCPYNLFNEFIYTAKPNADLSVSRMECKHNAPLPSNQRCSLDKARQMRISASRKQRERERVL